MQPIKEVYRQITGSTDQYLHQLASRNLWRTGKLYHPSKQTDVPSKGKMVWRGHWAEQEGEYKQGKLTLGCQKRAFGS